MRNGLGSRTTVWNQMLAYELGDSSALATWAKRLFSRVCGGSEWLSRALRALYLKAVRHRAAHDLFTRYRPDVLVALSLTADLDAVVACTARQRGVPIIGMTRSWDNLTSKGVLRVPPDCLLLQNAFLERVAAEYQGLGGDRLFINF